MMDLFGKTDQPMERLPRRQKPPYSKVVLPVLATVSGVLLGFALPALIGAESFVDYVKCLLFAVGGGFVSYGVNRFAIEWGGLHRPPSGRGSQHSRASPRSWPSERVSSGPPMPG